MPRTLRLSVRFHDGRYHGTGSWPPAPARLFQALVAGAARGSALAAEDRAALEWLERLDPPVIVAPRPWAGQGFTAFVPNNDLDAVGGDPARIGDIRVGKTIRPRLFDPTVPLVYLWRYEQGEDHARAIARLAEHLYQLGRGVDMAWADADTLEGEPDPSGLDGVVHRPSRDGADNPTDCPVAGSLDSLVRRFAQLRRRFSWQRDGRTSRVVFAQPPKPLFRVVGYDCPPWRRLFELRTEGRLASWPLAQVAALVIAARDGAAERLGPTPEIERLLVGRGATAADKARRVRLLPLPSVGHRHADMAIRRLMVEVPPDAGLRVDDLEWAFSGLDVGGAVLVPGEDHRMPWRYGIGADTATEWRTVTPAALPVARHGSRSAEARLHTERDAAAAALQALRHAGVAVPVAAVTVQREPFHTHGARAEAFALAGRFPPERLWHLSLRFQEPVAGALGIGDGRYCGLGLLLPVRQ
jgi:CRISPR-associated protein Csb2